MVTTSININGPNQESMDAMIGAFASSKGWLISQGESALEFARRHLANYFNEGINSFTESQINIVMQAQKEAAKAALEQQASQFSITVTTE